MQVEPVESPKDLTRSEGKAAEVEIWTKEIENSSANEKKWRDEANKFFDIYIDQHNDNLVRYNVFWSNTQTLRPLIFSKLPKPNITQRFLDKDEISRIASEMMERSINLYLSDEDAETVISKSRDDFLIGGRGVARVVYDPEDTYDIDVDVETIDPTTGEIKTEKQKQTEIDSSVKRCRIEYVDWRNFRISPEKEWRDVRWIAFRRYMSRDELVEKFGAKKGKSVSLNVTRLSSLEEKNRPQNELYKMAEVWEIWDKQSKSVKFITIGSDGKFLDEEKDPYNLKNFFPTPKPLGSESDPKCLIPIPLYRFYKAQAEELNLIDKRIKSLIEQCKATGVYSSIAEGSDMQALFNGEDGEMTAMRSTGGLAIKDAVLFKPLNEIVTTIIQLNDRKDRVINSIRDITGISDIVRGVSVASETATAQELKGNFAISRIQPLQKEIEVWVRDLIRLEVELTVENYSIEELAQMTNLQIVDIKKISEVAKQNLNNLLNEAKNLIDPSDPQAAEKMQQLQSQAEAGFKKTLKKPLEDLKGYAATPEQLVELDKLIKNDKLRTFAIDVETDSTIRIDQQQEKQDRIEYVTAISNFANSFFPLVQGGIMTTDTFNQFLIFISKPFKIGRNMEEFLLPDENQEPKGPTVEEMLAQAESQRKDKELELKTQVEGVKADQGQQKLNIQKAEVKFKVEAHQDNMEFEDVNRQADRESKRVDQVVKSKTALLTEEIRQANKPTQI